MPGNSQRRGAVRRKGRSQAAGSGGRIRRGLEGKGPTPKAADRPYHPAHRAKSAAQGAAGEKGAAQRAAGAKPAARGAAGAKGTVQRRGRAGGPSRKPGPKPTGRPGAGPEWVVGRNAALEALQAGVPVQTAYVAEGADRDDRLRDILRFAAEQHRPLLQVTRGELDRMTGGAVHQGVALKLAAYSYAHLDDLIAAPAAAGTVPLLVALDHVTDPRNLGAVVRSAAAFGAAGVIIPQRRSAGLTAAAWKTSAGAAARLPIAQVPNLHQALRTCGEAGFVAVGLAADADTDIADLTNLPEAGGPLVLVIGAEGEGLSRLVRQSCDLLAAIPITSAVESLNAGVAAGIALYELGRTRR